MPHYLCFLYGKQLPVQLDSGFIAWYLCRAGWEGKPFGSILQLAGLIRVLSHLGCLQTSKETLWPAGLFARHLRDGSSCSHGWLVGPPAVGQGLLWLRGALGWLGPSGTCLQWHRCLGGQLGMSLFASLLFDRVALSFPSLISNIFKVLLWWNLALFELQRLFGLL